MSQLDKDIMSKISILEDNNNKIKIINQINEFEKKTGR